MLLRRDLAAIYVDMTPAQFERAVIEGTIPQPLQLVGEERWSRIAMAGMRG